MGFLDRFLKKQDKNTVEKEYIDDDVVSEISEPTIHSWDSEDDEDIQVNMPSMADEKVVADEQEVDIHYHGGLLAPTTRTKQEQYQEILAELEHTAIGGMQTVLETIERALQEEEHIHDVFARIEEQNIPILALVALELASEEDIAAYQLKKERNLGVSTETDTSYVQEMRSAQTTPSQPKEPLPYEETEDVFAQSTQPSFPSFEQMNAPVHTEAPIQAERQTELPGQPTFPSFEQVEQPTVQAEMSAQPAFPSFEQVEQPNVQMETPVQPTFPSFEQMAQPSVQMETPVQPAFPSFEQVEQPNVQVEQPSVQMEMPTQETVQPSAAQPTETLSTFGFKETPPQPKVEFKPPTVEAQTETMAEEATNPNAPTPEKPSGVFASLFEKEKKTEGKKSKLGLNFEGFIESEVTVSREEEEPPKVPEKETKDDTNPLGGLQELLSLATKLGQQPMQPQASTENDVPKLTEEQLMRKRRAIKKHERSAKVNTKRIFIIWEGIQLPQVEGYAFYKVNDLRDLNRYGLDADDLLVVSSKVPTELAADIPQYVRNLQEDSKPYRVVTISKKPYTEVEIPQEILGFTKDALDTYYAENIIELDNKNQLSGFAGFADFISKD